MAILSGLLNVEIEFQSRIDSKNSTGRVLYDYDEVNVKRRWATHKNGNPDLPITTNNYNDTQNRYVTYYDTFTIRYDEDINYLMRILYDGVYYKIIKINPIERKQNLVIYAEKVEGNDYGV